jgi:hypothetical protein
MQSRNGGPIAKRAAVAIVLTLGALLATHGSGIGEAGGNAAPNPAQAVVGEIANVDQYGAVHDGRSHPLRMFYKSLSAAAAVCPSLNMLAGYTTTADTHGNSTIDNIAAIRPYVTIGQTVTGTGIPAHTTVTSVNYRADTATLSRAATATGGGVSVTFGFGVDWSTVERDWCAIDAAIWAVRKSGGAASAYSRAVWLPGGSYVVNQPINLTCLSTPTVANSNCLNTADHYRTFVYLNGSTIAGAIAPTDYGSAFIDLMGSNGIEIEKGTFYQSDRCNGTAIRRGIQLGRILNGVSAGNVILKGIALTGSYSQTPFYNLASEDSGTEASFFRTCDTTGKAYGGIYDGGAHFPTTSDYTPVVMTRDRPQSFNDTWDLGSSFWPIGRGSGPGLFIYGTRRLRLQNTYVVAGPVSNPCLTLYSGTSGDGDSAVVADMLTADLHCEGKFDNLVSVVSRRPSTVTLKDLTLRDHFAFATAHIFALGTNTTGVRLLNPAIVFSNSIREAPFLFDKPAAWSLNDFRNVHLQGSTIRGFLPSVDHCTGLGVGGSCGLPAGAGDKAVSEGEIILAAGSRAGPAGSVTLNFPARAVNQMACVFTLGAHALRWRSMRSSTAVSFCSTHKERNGTCLF